jgi:hypothetical protein
MSTPVLNPALGSTIAGGTAAPNFNIPYICPANTPQELVPYLQPIYSAFQNLIQTLILDGGIAPRSASQLLSSLNDPTAFLSGNVHRFYTQALEMISFGAPISLVTVGGVTYARNASALDTSLPPHGFCSNSGGLAGDALGEVQLVEGMIVNAFNNLTVGKIYYLGNTPGTYSLTPGLVSYPVAFSITSTTLLYRAFSGLT